MAGACLQSSHFNGAVKAGVKQSTVEPPAPGVRRAVSAGPADGGGGGGWSLTLTSTATGRPADWTVSAVRNQYANITIIHIG